MTTTLDEPMMSWTAVEFTGNTVTCVYDSPQVFVDLPYQDDSVADDLRSAAELIRRHGWARHHMVNELGGLCVLGAMAQVAGVLHKLLAHGHTRFPSDPGMYRYRMMAAAFGHYLVRNKLSHNGTIPVWNDSTRDLTREDVLTHLEKCAAQYEETGCR